MIPGLFSRAAPKGLAPLVAFALVYPLVGEGIPDLDMGSVRVYWEAFLIPLSLLFGWGGIIGVSVGVLLMNLYLSLSGQEHLSPTFLALQPVAFFAALSLAYRIVRRYPSLEGYVAGMAAFTAVMTVTVGGYWAVTTGRLIAMLELLASSVVPINVAGPLLMAGASRWSMRAVPGRRSRQ